MLVHVRRDHVAEQKRNNLHTGVTNTNPNVNGQTIATYTSPAMPVTVNPDLRSLTVSGVALNFSPSHTFYGGVVPSSTSSVVVNEAYNANQCGLHEHESEHDVPYCGVYD